MAIYSVAPVDQEPVEQIFRWSIREVVFPDETKSQHLVGVIERNRHGRVTSAIQAFDAENMKITTLSGRIYYLTGDPGNDPDAEYVWRGWCLKNEVQNFIDVTHEYLKIH